jgi:hypothetical protein
VSAKSDIGNLNTKKPKKTKWARVPRETRKKPRTNNVVNWQF